MKATRAVATDQRDSQRKVARAREIAKNNPALALAMAEAIEATPSLLDGAGEMVRLIATHPEAAKVLERVFLLEARNYPATYRVFAAARLKLARS